MAQTTSLSSVGTSAAIMLNPVLKTTTIQLSFSSTATTAGAVQFTLDDPTITPAPTVTWATLSSVDTSSGGLATATGGVILTVLSPLGGLRLSSTTAGATMTLKAIQSITG